MENQNSNPMDELFASDSFIRWASNPEGKEKEYWEKYMKEHPGKEKEIREALDFIQSIKVQERDLSQIETIALWTQVYEKVRERERFRVPTWIRYAASIALIIGLSLSYYLYQKAGEPEVNYALIERPTTMEREITLILGDNSSITIPKTESEIKYDKNGEILVNAVGINQPDKPTDQDQIIYHQLVVPNGKRSSIIFPDGTRAWVNAGSRVIYPSRFEGKRREIFVEGEVYLDVTRNEALPFHVKTSTMEVRVLGTSFNINSYEDASLKSVVLVNGSVEVLTGKRERIKMVPNTMLEFHPTTGQARTKVVDAYKYISWKDGFLSFESEELGYVLAKLSRYYDVKINMLDPGIKSFKMSGKLDMKDSIEIVMGIIAETAPVNFEKDNQGNFQVTRKKI